MKALRIIGLTLLPLVSQPLLATDLTTEAAIGGAIGGALGGALGAELGGREGAIIGAGVGAAAGTAIATKDEAPTRRHVEEPRRVEERVYIIEKRGRGRGSFCPPGQAKKGRC